MSHRSLQNQGKFLPWEIDVLTALHYSDPYNETEIPASSKSFFHKL